MAGRQKSLTKPSWTPCILARALVASGSITVRAVRARVDRGLGAIADGRDLRVGEHVGGTGRRPQRRDRVAERVPHRDPALHRGHRGEQQHPGAVAGGVDARTRVRDTRSTLT